MDLRHLRCFIAVAEELHFGRAARRLHIEQSPLSRTIRKLETTLGVTLLSRTPRGASLTWAGRVFLEDARRVMLSVEQAVARARAAASGFQGTLRIALSRDLGRARLPALLALCRAESPQVKIRLSEVPLTELVQGLNADLFDAGFAMIDEVEDGIVAQPLWADPLVVAPARTAPAFSLQGGAAAGSGELSAGTLRSTGMPRLLSAARTTVPLCRCSTDCGRVRRFSRADADAGGRRVRARFFHCRALGNLPAGGCCCPPVGRSERIANHLSVTNRGWHDGAAAAVHRTRRTCMPSGRKRLTRDLTRIYRKVRG